MHFTNSLGLSLLGYAATTTAAATNLTGTYHRLAAASYHLVDSRTSANFFSSFSFFTGTDPTHGFVDFKDAASATAAGLINTNNGKIYMGVDHTTTNPSSGRASVRVSSNKAYHHGLFIADIAHMPESICGVWPSFWLFGPNWPTSGEIDVIQGVNLGETNKITLLTTPGCSINTAGSQAGTSLVNDDCNSNSGYNGCSATTANAYGSAFNRNGGGVYAMHDIASEAPVTGKWGTPLVASNGGSGCDINAHFANQNITFDTTFCGDWAGAADVWGTSSCAAKGTCQNFVSANPGAFAPAYWSDNSVKAYQQ